MTTPIRDTETPAPPRRPLSLRFFDGVERIGNKLPDPITLFALFAVLVIVVSWIAARAGVAAVHPGTGDAVEVVNLLSFEGLRRIVEREGLPLQSPMPGPHA